MTLAELIEFINQHPWIVLTYFLGLPLSAHLATRAYRRSRLKQSWLYVFSFFVYFSCIPGIASASLTAYRLIFDGAGLLDLSVLIYILPVVSMVLTLYIIRRKVSFDSIPGFDRIWGLIIIIFAVIVMFVAIDKMRILLIFRAPIYWLILFFAVFVLMMVYGWRKMQHKK